MSKHNNKPMTNSRRKFLTGTATTGAAALALSAFPPSIRRALALPANNKTGTIKDVEHVGGQQVGGELHALETQPERGGQRMRQGGLAQARQVLDQQVSVGEQGDERELHLARLAEHQRIHLRLRAGEGVGQAFG